MTATPSEPGHDDHGHNENGPDDVARLRAERDALRIERDTLQSRLAQPRPGELPKPKRRRGRKGLVGVLVGLSCLLVTLSTVVVWTHRTILNTDTFVGTVAPVFEDPVVVNAAAAQTTNQLFTSLDVEARLKAQLPEKADFIAEPLTNGAKGFVESSLSKVMRSPQFQRFWRSTLEFTHRQVVAVLRGQSSPVLSTTGGTVVINTVPVINQALAQVSGLASSIAGKPVTLPTITSAELPASAVNKLDNAFGVQLPANFGQITLFKSNKLSAVQRGVRAFDGLAIVLPLITIAFIALTLWLSLSRRRSLVELLAVSMLLLIVVRRVVVHVEGQLVAKANDPTVARHVFDQVLGGFFTLTAAILWTALAILVVTLVTGPYRWAVALRAWVRRGWEWLAEQLNADRRRTALGWLAAHAGGLQLAGAVLAAIAFLVVSVTWVSFLVIGILLAAYEVALGLLRARPEALAGTEPPRGPTPPQPDEHKIREPVEPVAAGSHPRSST